MSRAASILSGKPLPVISETPKKLRTPCETCPKWQLHKNHANPGLLPKNELPARLYYLARRPERVGTMDGAYIQWTMTPGAAHAVLEEWTDEFPHPQARRECFELMTLIDQVATDVQCEREEKARERSRKKSEKK